MKEGIERIFIKESGAKIDPDFGFIWLDDIPWGPGA